MVISQNQSAELGREAGGFGTKEGKEAGSQFAHQSNLIAFCSTVQLDFMKKE
jgi:hypothetical protein